ncbi:hypothetical protein B6D29_02225, partial [Microgenomates bacterium UTCPR1]
MSKINSDLVRKTLEQQLPKVPVSISVLGKTDRPNSWTYKTLLDGDNCVIKVIKPARRDDEPYFISEEEALDRINKRKDIRTVPYIEKGDIFLSGTKLMYFIFPFVEGLDLDEFIRKNPNLSEEKVLGVLKPLITTILKLGEEGIIHQDIKPGNIKINDKGEITLLDYGIARFTDHDSSLSKQQGPARYLSPEQIELGLDRVPMNQRKITVLSDIYSACVVALNMILGIKFYSDWKPDQRQVMVNAINSGTIFNFTNEELKKLLSTGLETSISKRAAIFKLVDPQSVEYLTNSKPGFKAVWNLQHWTTGSEILTDFAKDNPSIREGVIFLSEHVRSVAKDLVRADELQKMGWRIAVDPSTYKLQFLPDYYACLADRDYKRTNVKPVQFLNHVFLKNFVKDVIDFQKLFNPNIYISPYFFISDVDDVYLDINFNLFEETKRQLAGSSTPLLFGIAISEKIIETPKKLDELLSQLILYPGVNAYYLRPELIKPNNQPCSNKEFLLGLTRLVTELTLNKSVLLAQLDQSSLGLFANSKLSVAINPEPSIRKSDIEDKHTSEKSSWGPKKKDKRTWVYIPELLTDIDLQRDFRRAPLKGFSRLGEITCKCKYCTSTQPKIDPMIDNDNRRSHF